MNVTEKKENVSRESPGSPESDVPEGFHPLQILVRRRWQLFACLLLVSSVAFVSLFFSKQKYRAAAQVQVFSQAIPDAANRGGLTAMMGDQAASQGDYFKTQCELLRSQRVLSRAAERLDLKVGGWAYGGGAVAAMRDRIQIEPVSGSRLINIVGTGDSGAEAAAIANQTMLAFVEVSAEAHLADKVRVIKQIESQVSKCEEDIQSQEEAIHQFRQEHLITGNNKSMGLVEAQVTQLEQELTNIQMERLAAKEKSEHLKKIFMGKDSSGGTGESLPEVENDKEANTICQKICDLESQERSLVQTYLPGHKKLSDVRSQITNLQEQLAERKRKILETVYEAAVESYTAMGKRSESLEAMLKQQQNKGVELTRWHYEYLRMQQELEVAYRLKSESMAQLRQFSLKEGMNDTPVVVVDSALVPSNPVGMSKSHRASSILLLGLLFSLLLVFAVDKFSTVPQASSSQSMGASGPVGMGQMGQWANWPPVMYWPVPSPGMAVPTAVAQGIEIDSPAEVSTGEEIAKTGLALGRIGNISLGGDSREDVAFAARCRIVHTDSSSVQAAAFREIGTSLLNRFGQTPQSVVITSSGWASGKSTCACNLALVLAQAGRAVLLVESDLRHVALNRVFATDQGNPGLIDVLADRDMLDESLQETDVANLSVLHCGNTEDRASTPSAMDLTQLNRDLADRFDWVIYDGPDLEEQLTCDLLQAVGRALFVSSSQENDTSQINDAIERIEHCGAINIGWVENSPLVTKVPGEVA